MSIYEIFISVVQTGSFSAAAKKLHRTPSSVSKKIIALEEELNVRLIDRTTRDLSVTEAGQLYYERCIEITSLIKQTHEALHGLSGAASGTLTITWPNTISTSQVANDIAAFKRMHPEICVDVTVDNAHINMVNESTDFAFRMNPDMDSSMSAIELFSVRPVICASPALIQRIGTPESTTALAHCPLVILNNNQAIQRFWRAVPGLEGLDVSTFDRVDDLNALYCLVKAGLGVSILREHMVKDDIESGELVALFNDTLTLPLIPVDLMFRKSAYPSAKTRAFVEFFKDRYL